VNKKTFISVYNANSYEEAERKRRKMVLKDSFKISFICLICLFLAGLMGDMVSIPLLSVIDPSQDIYTNIELFMDYWYLGIILFGLLVLISVGLLEYLQHGK
jgi:hypothetical protein